MTPDANGHVEGTTPLHHRYIPSILKLILIRTFFDGLSATKAVTCCNSALRYSTFFLTGKLSKKITGRFFDIFGFNSADLIDLIDLIELIKLGPFRYKFHQLHQLYRSISNFETGGEVMKNH